jgi:hypothetical protein
MKLQFVNGPLHGRKMDTVNVQHDRCRVVVRTGSDADSKLCEHSYWVCQYGAAVALAFHEGYHVRTEHG